MLYFRSDVYNTLKSNKINLENKDRKRRYNMRIKSQKFYEGFNITGQKHTLQLVVTETSLIEFEKYSNIYIQVSRVLGFDERIIEIVEHSGEIKAWMSYFKKEVSELIWSQIENGECCFKNIVNNVSYLVLDKTLDSIYKQAEITDIPFMKINKDSYQLGYGSASVRVGKDNKEEVFKLIKEKSIKSIPVFAVTGTNGKTTTSRLLYHMLMKLRYNAGLTNTGSIMVGREKLEIGDTTGFFSSRKLLADKRIDAAVLETARGGIIHNGLGFEKIDVAIITSLSEDHLGLLGVNNLEELMRVKAVVLKGVKRCGKWILKAQSEILKEAKKNLEDRSFIEKVLLFDINKNSFIQEHLSLGGEAMYLEGDYIVYHKSGAGKRILSIRDILFTHGGLSMGNVLNVMAVLLALSTIEKDMQYLAGLIKNIPCDILHNPGRQNILDIGSIKVLIDYGHNPEAYKTVYSIVDTIRQSRVTSIITAPGDRQDRQIEELGYIAGTKSNFIIIREQKDARGSEQGRVANLMAKGAYRAGKSDYDIDYQEQAGEALVYALKRAIPGEIIVIFTEYLQPVIERLNEYIVSSKKSYEIPYPILSD